MVTGREQEWTRDELGRNAEAEERDEDHRGYLDLPLW